MADEILQTKSEARKARPIICGRGKRKTVADIDEMEMLALRQKGWTLRAIGAEYELTRQRIQQIMAKYFVKEAAQITAPKIRKPRAKVPARPTRNRALILTWSDGSTSSETTIASSIRKYGLPASLGVMIHRKSTQKIYSKVLDAYVISARLLVN